MRLNKHQLEWLKRIHATPKGMLWLYGLRQMQSRTRDVLRGEGYVTWVPILEGRGITGICYTLTEKGKQEVEKRQTPLPEPSMTEDQARGQDELNGL